MKQKFKLISAAIFAGIALAGTTNAQTQTTNYVTKFGATPPAIVNSLIFDNATNVSIGLGGAGSYKLDVNGHINIASSSAYKIGGSNVLWHNGGTSNIYVGVDAGGAASAGTDNVFTGYRAGYVQNSGSDNVFTGFYAGYTNSTGINNVFDGSYAGVLNTTGSNNVVVGAAANYSNVTGSYNTIVGKEAGKGAYNNSFSGNSLFGFQAGYGTTTGLNNVSMGYQAGYTSTTGSSNVAIGYQAGFTNTTGGSNVAIGYASLFNNNADNEIGIGLGSLYNNATGTQNVAIGINALYSNITGFNNTAVGYQALYYNTNNDNTAFGTSALQSNTSGYYNNASGWNALFTNTTGFANTAFGGNALYYSSTSNYNTALGYKALYNTTGYSNTACGEGALSTNTSGYNNTALGFGANCSTGALNNATAIGYNASVTGSNDIVLGNSSITSIHAAVTTITAISDGRFKTNVTENVKGLEFIKKLRPVTYNLNTNGLDDFIIQNLSDSLKTFHKQGMNFASSTAIVHSGFIAQEVEQAALQVGFNSSIVYHPQNNSDPYGLGYAEFVVPLVKAVQELSKAADSTNTAIAKKDSINAATLQALQNKINQLDAIINSCCTINTSKSMQQNSDSQTAAKQTNVELSNKNIVVLDQNVPNPFAEQTTINYFLPDNATRAQIIFLDQSGKLIKAVDLTEKGKGQLNVFASDLSSGIYIYSLIVDGQTMETKKMVKTK